MKNCQSSVLGVVFMLLASQPIQAHPGHSLGEHGVAHVVNSPFHVAMLLGIALCCWSATWFVSHSVGRRVLRFGAMAAVAAAAFLWSSMA